MLSLSVRSFNSLGGQPIISAASELLAGKAHIAATAKTVTGFSSALAGRQDLTGPCTIPTACEGQKAPRLLDDGQVTEVKHAPFTSAGLELRTIVCRMLGAAIEKTAQSDQDQCLDNRETVTAALWGCYVADGRRS
jgi:hypothetical protein